MLPAARLLLAALLLVDAASIVVVFHLPSRQSALASPFVVTAGAFLLGLWFAASSDRDARARLEIIKLSFAEDGDLRRLLRNYWLVLLVVVLRLQALLLCGLLVAVWGKGPVAATPLLALAALLSARAWPRRSKIKLLLQRVGVTV